MKFYISMGDLNGISAQIAIQSHQTLQQQWKDSEFVYGIDEDCLKKCKQQLHITQNDVKLQTIHLCKQDLTSLFDSIFPHSPIKKELLPVLKPFDPPIIRPGEICQDMGLMSAKSFLFGILLAEQKDYALITLPIHKQAWAKANLPFKGHTELLRMLYQKDVIMALGCQDMLVFLYTDHIALHDVSEQIEEDKIYHFLTFLSEAFAGMQKCGVLGLNPHAGDHGLMGMEDEKIAHALLKANQIKHIFHGPLVPDAAFTPENRKKFKYFVAMYHDQGLIPLKALYFEESVNISLGLPIIRVSVDHGTAFDKAYKNQPISYKSYQNTFDIAYQMILNRRKS